MIWPNEDARDWEARMDVQSDWRRSLTGIKIEAPHLLEITWGKPFSTSSPKHGIKLFLKNWIDSGEPAVSPAINYEIRLQTPWDADQIFTGSVWLGDSTTTYPMRIEIDGQELEVGDCDAFQLDFTELRLYLDGVLEYTLGAQTDSGSGYDIRDNRVKLDVDPFMDPQPLPSKPDCSTVVRDTYALSDIVDGGYRYRDHDDPSLWLYDEIVIEDYEPPAPAPVGGCPACDCETPASVPGLDPARPKETDSWYVQISAAVQDTFVKTFVARVDCDCDPPGSPWTYDGYTLDWDYFDERGSVLVEPNTKGVNKTYREAGARCYCSGLPPSYTVNSETVVEFETKAQYDVDIYGIESDTLCCDEVTPGSCGLVEPEDPPPVVPTCAECLGIEDPPDRLCVYEEYRKVEHPEEPTCVQRLLSYDVSPSNRHARAVGDTTDELFLQASANLQPRLGWSSPVPGGFDAIDATLRWVSGLGKLRVVYAKPGGGIELRETTNEGSTWSAATVVSATGTRTAYMVGRSNAQYIYWVDAGALKGQIWDLADNVLVSTFTVRASGVDDKTISVDEVRTQGGKWQLVIRYFTSGALIERFSTDGQNLS